MGEALGRFTDLTHLSFGPTASGQQEVARGKFADLIEGSALKSAHFFSTPKVGTFLTIGAATWSKYDMQLLDQIDDQLRNQMHHRLTISVFDFDDCENSESFDERIPGIGEVLQSPAVGLWADGKLTQTATGFEARKLVERVVLAESMLQNFHSFQTTGQPEIATVN